MELYMKKIRLKKYFLTSITTGIFLLLPLSLSPFSSLVGYITKGMERKPDNRIVDSLKNQVDYIKPLSLADKLTNNITIAHDSTINPFRDNIFIIKANEPSRAFADILGSYIGNACGITGNYVRVLPHKHRPADLQEYPDTVYTIHSFVRGKTPFEDEKDKGNSVPFSKISILLEDITFETLEKIATRNDLLDIIMLDFFMLNGDRHKGNYIYDKDDDRFIGIDMDHCLYPLAPAYHPDYPEYMVTPAQAAHDYLIEQIDNKTQFSSAARMVFKRQIKTLEKLVTTFPMKKFLKVARIIARQTKYELDEALLKRILTKNYNDCNQLISLLKKITTT